MDNIDFSKVEKTKFEMSVRVLKPVIIFLEKKYNRDTVDHFIDETGLNRKYIDNEHNWISFEYYSLFLEKLVNFTANPRAPFESGVYVLSKEAYGSIYSLLIVLKLFGSPKIAYKKLCEFSSAYSNIGKFVIISLKKNKAIIKSSFNPGYSQTKLNCDAIQGQLTAIPLFWNLPPAKVKEVECAVDGAESCLYEVSWVSRSLKKDMLFSFPAIIFAAELLLFFFGKLPWLDIKVLILSGLFFFVIILLGRNHDFKKLLEEHKVIHEERSKVLAAALNNSKKEYMQQREANIRIFEVVNKLTILNFIAEEIFQINTEDELIKKVLNIIAGCMNFDRASCLFFNEHFEAARSTLVLDIANNRDLKTINWDNNAVNKEIVAATFEKNVPRQLVAGLVDNVSTDTLLMPLSLRDNYYLFLFDNYHTLKPIKSSKLIFFSTIANQVRLALDNIYIAGAAHNIMSSIPSAILVFDRATSEISFVNKAYLDNYHVESSAVLGRSIIELLNISSLNRDLFLEKIGELSEYNYIDSQELSLNNRIIGYTLFKIPNNTRGKSEIGIVMKDITRQKELQEQLLRSEKLAALGTLASGVAHEINNPLYGVLGTAEVIVDEAEAPEIKKMAEDIIDFTMQVSDIVKDLSAYSRSIREEKPKEVNINDIIDEALRIIRYSPIFINVKIEKEFGVIPSLFGMGGEISQIFMNLINNALQAMNGKGKLKIFTDYKNKFIQVIIEDSGPGIPPEIISRIFDPFFTTKPAGEGTGLGLNIVYRLVTKYNGFIKVVNCEPRGARFIIEFPVQERS